MTLTVRYFTQQFADIDPPFRPGEVRFRQLEVDNAVRAAVAASAGSPPTSGGDRTLRVQDVSVREFFDASGQRRDLVEVRVSNVGPDVVLLWRINVATIFE